MHTLSGRRFDLGGKFVPSARDIAVGLSRIPRWAGATVRPWSVLQHSLAALAVARSRELTEHEQLAVLLHDMEEIATGDIPAPFKTDAQRNLADQLRQWMYRGTFGLDSPSPRIMKMVHLIDKDIASAEAHALTHPLVVRQSEEFAEWELDAVDAVWGLIGVSEEHAIEIFMGAVMDLMGSPKIRALVRMNA